MSKYWIDTDTGSDDAVALMLAFAHIGDEIQAISTVCGNVPVEQATTNAAYIARLCGQSVAIHQGAVTPLRRPLQSAQHVHGIDGMGDIGLELGTAEPSGQSAATALIAAIHTQSEPLEIITLGPLTNIALAMSIDPTIVQHIKRITIMGGTSDYYGNITPVSEYNVWADPEAADIVFRSLTPKLMVGWDISRKFAVISDAQAQGLLTMGTQKAEVAVTCQAVLREFCRNQTGLDGFDLPDPIAVAAAINPGVITASTAYSVSVCCDEGPTRGMTILSDRHHGNSPKTTQVATDANRDLFLDLLHKALV